MSRACRVLLVSLCLVSSAPAVGSARAVPQVIAGLEYGRLDWIYTMGSDSYHVRPDLYGLGLGIRPGEGAPEVEATVLFAGSRRSGSDVDIRTWYQDQPVLTRGRHEIHAFRLGLRARQRVLNRLFASVGAGYTTAEVKTKISGVDAYPYALDSGEPAKEGDWTFGADVALTRTLMVGFERHVPLHRQKPGATSWNAPGDYTTFALTLGLR